MSSNSNSIVQEIRQELELLLTYVENAKEEVADQVERHLFTLLLGMGAQLMGLFFVLRSHQALRTQVINEEGQELPYFGERKRDYFSIFGKVACERPYFYQPGAGGATRLDAELSLGADCYSDLLREVAEYLAVDMPYEKVVRLFDRLLGHSLAKNSVQSMIDEDAQDVVAYYAQKPVPPVEEEGSMLVAQADGKGVPMVRERAAPAKVRLGKGDKRTQKKESIVTTVYSIDPNPRTPEEVVASIFHKEERTDPKRRSDRVKPQHKQLWATLAGKDTALQRLTQQTAQRDGAHIQQRLALTDGAEALQNRVLSYLPDFTLILDFIHANEYLWKVANALFSEQNPQRIEWMEAHTLKMLSGHTLQIIAEFRTKAQAPKTRQIQREQLQKTANYFERNLDYMAYVHYLAQGWPIASGVIEGACRHVVKDRCEQSGMRWTLPGVENLLRLRAVAINDDWDDYHQFRKRQRHQRLYHLPFPQQSLSEQAVLNADALTSKNAFRFNFTSTKHSICQPLTPDCLAA